MISSSDSDSWVDTNMSSKDATSSTVTSSNVLSRLMSCVPVSFSTANGSSDTASFSSISQKSAFLKQFCTVLSVTLSHEKTSIFIASNTEMFGSDLLPSIATIIFWATFVLYLAFKERMTP